jgi:hypothetical protein
MRTLIALAALAGTPTWALAENLLFSGTVGSACLIVAHDNGDLSLDVTGTYLTSAGNPLHAGSVTLLASAGAFINVGPPSRTDQPGAYVATGEAVSVKYKGDGALNTVDQDWTSVGTSHAVNSLIGTGVKIDNRIYNPNGFAPGDYQTTTVVTCTASAQY